MRMIRGSCLCGGVKYQINGALSHARNCHCTMCRKAQGAAFRSRASAKATEFEWLQGDSLVTFYESSPGNFRGFCSVCGSPVVTKFGDASYCGVPLGALDDDPGVRPELHVHVADKAPWFTITDDLPQFAAGPV
jgi:hypothetical protein